MLVFQCSNRHNIEIDLLFLSLQKIVLILLYALKETDQEYSLC